MTRVRFPSPAPVGEQSFLRLLRQPQGPCGSVVEHSLGKGEVGSSILPMGTIISGALARWGCAKSCCSDLDFFRSRDRKSTRLNSSHLVISYAVFCLKK